MAFRIFTGEAERPSMRTSAGEPLDVGAAAGELFLEPLEAAIEMIDAVDHGLAVGHEARYDE